jgi:hypothetical protein
MGFTRIANSNLLPSFFVFPSLPSVLLTGGNEENEEEGNDVGNSLRLLGALLLGSPSATASWRYSHGKAPWSEKPA